MRFKYLNRRGRGENAEGRRAYIPLRSLRLLCVLCVLHFCILPVEPSRSKFLQSFLVQQHDAGIDDIDQAFVFEIGEGTVE